MLVSMATTPELVSVLRDAHLRVTRPRLAVLSAVRAEPHLDTDAVIHRARQELGHVSHQAVYDVLRALTEAGLLRRIQPAGATARYEPWTGDNHHHVVCRSCGAIENVACAVGEAPCLVASDDHGFQVDEAEVVYWGICPDCRERERSRAASSDGASRTETTGTQSVPGTHESGPHESGPHESGPHESGPAAPHPEER